MSAHTSVVDRQTIRTAGISAVFVIVGTAILLEPWLRSQNAAELALLIYVLMLPVIVYSLLEDLRNWRQTE